MSLVLSRLSGESIQIGDDIRITIGQVITEMAGVKLERPKVKLVFDAPRSVNIIRTELLDRPKPACSST